MRAKCLHGLQLYGNPIRMARAVNSTLSGESQALATASGTVEWLGLMLGEALDGPFDPRVSRDLLCRRPPTQAHIRWIPTNRMLADGLTKDKIDPIDLLRSCIRSGNYQISPEAHVLAQQATERQRRLQRHSQPTPASCQKGPVNAMTLPDEESPL